MRYRQIFKAQLFLLNSLVGLTKWFRGRVIHYLGIDLSWISVQDPLFGASLSKVDHEFCLVKDALLHSPSGNAFLINKSLSDRPRLIKETSIWEPIHAQFSFGIVPKRFPSPNDDSRAYFPIPNSDNYYHWLVDVLPWIIKSTGISQDFSYIHFGSLKSYQLEALSILGVRSNMVGAWISLSQLIVPTNRILTGVIDEVNLKTLQEFGSRVSTKENSSKIYISRRNSSRNLKNEFELEKFLTDNQFDVLFLEEMSFQEQIHAFSSAKVIISPHGAGLANIVFCNSQVKILEIINPRISNPCFSLIANYHGFIYSSISYSEVEEAEDFSSILHKLNHL